MRDHPKPNHSSTKGNRSYVCRVCRHPHALRKCKRFLEMNTTKRLQVVDMYGYCKNCLAHTHSQGRCFTTTGCRYCHQKHHSLLHLHPRLQQDSEALHRHRQSIESTHQNRSSRSRSNNPNPIPHKSKPEIKSASGSQAKSSTVSLSTILKQNIITLLPTAIVQIKFSKEIIKVRCILDSGSKYSRISMKIVNQLRLNTYSLNEETACPITLTSVYDPDINFEVTLRVSSRISIHTPERSLPSSYKTNFNNVMLADAKFYRSSPVDIILGVDIYSRVICEGILSRPGLPTAQNTIFGWAIYGNCSI